MKIKQDWFDLEIIIEIGDFSIPFYDFKDHILQKDAEYLLPDGKIFIIPSAWFAELQAVAFRTQKNNLSIFHKTQASLLQDNSIIETKNEISANFDDIDAVEKIDIPKSITANLRPYQVSGFYWLSHRVNRRFGVCLADDMGLGKTLQIITLLQYYFQDRYNQDVNESTSKPQLSLFDIPEEIAQPEENIFKSVLLIVPRSLIHNWIDELNKFAPDLTYGIYYGNKRHQELKGILHKKHIIITTYGVVRKDIMHLRKETFSFLILDESQAIKNPNSQNYQAAIQLQAERRISVTGTPFENKLQDIWSQMNFLNPQMLGNLKQFEETYVRPIGKDANSAEAKELQKLIQPFILRRLKQDVAKDLPEKIEQIIYCDMSDEQTDLYEHEKSAVRNALLFDEKTKNYVQKLTVLNHLRQIALHPLMIKPKTTIESGKFNTIIQYIEVLMEQGSKFLIFSSFVKYLNLFKDYFIKQGIDYSMLTGKDTNRGDIVKDYQNTASVLPFLISIKAGGVGLNITSATYVLLVDPWWNPFVEQQAIDRTHRIGQTQNVNIYKFISKNTIEEKILQLQDDKRLMSKGIIGNQIADSLDMQDLEKILE